MRQLKFRVWNGMEMIYDVTVGKFGAFYVNPGGKGNGLDPKDSASLTSFTTKYPDAIPVMQFTGLLDKNGKEIWDGDLMCKEGKPEYIYEVKYNQKRCRYLLVLVKAPDPKRIGQKLALTDETNKIVIGNIYEGVKTPTGI
jgi:uncharacterized phage protein (TIGR01671 family)